METLHIFLTSVDILKDAFSREIFQRNLKVDISFGKHSIREGLVFTCRSGQSVSHGHSL